MADLTPVCNVTVVPEGMLLTPAEFAQLQTNLDSYAGQIVGAMGGPNLLPALSPVQVIPQGGMRVNVGAYGQRMICQGTLLDSVTPYPQVITAAGAGDRLDLIAVKATRPNGTVNITRNVRSDTAAPTLYSLTGTLVAGTKTLNLPYAYTSAGAPQVVATATTSGVEIAATANTTTVTVTSASGTDTRSFTVFVLGAPDGSSGTPQTITLLQNQPSYAYVVGSSMSVPNPPVGYEGFATIWVHAGETSIATSDIAYLFPQIPVLNTAMQLTSLLTTGFVTVQGLLVAQGSLIATGQVAGRFEQNSSTGAYTAIQIIDTAPGATAVPSKFIRIDHATGNLSIMSNDMTRPLLSLADAGGATVWGAVQAALAPGSLSSWVPPLYNLAGSATSGNAHTLLGTVSVVTDVTGKGTQPVAFPANFRFTSAATYVVSATLDNIGGTSAYPGAAVQVSVQRIDGNSCLVVVSSGPLNATLTFGVTVTGY